MKRAAFIVFVLVLWLATCNAPGPKVRAPTETAIPTEIPATETTVHFDTLSATPPTPTEVSSPQGATVSEAKLPAPPFPAILYASRTGGFVLDYPDGWTVSETVVGDRGTEIATHLAINLATDFTY